MKLYKYNILMLNATAKRSTIVASVLLTMIQLRIDIRKILTWKYLLYLKLVNYKDALRRPYYIQKKKN